MMRRGGRKIGWIAAAAAAVLLSAGAVLWRMTWLPPAWWSPLNPVDVQAQAMAESVEYGLVEQAQKVRPEAEAPWAVRVKQEQINAWLASRLPQWLAHERDLVWPEQVSSPQVRIEPEGMTIGVGIEREGWRGEKRFVSARFLPRVEEGKLMVTLGGVSVGRVTLPGAPATALLKQLEAAAPNATWNREAVSRVVAMLTGGEGIEAMFRLEDGRLVELTDVELEEGAIVMHCVTMQKSAVRTVEAGRREAGNATP